MWVAWPPGVPPTGDRRAARAQPAHDRSHLRGVFARLGIRSRIELVRLLGESEGGRCGFSAAARRGWSRGFPPAKRGAGVEPAPLRGVPALNLRRSRGVPGAESDRVPVPAEPPGAPANSVPRAEARRDQSTPAPSAPHQQRSPCPPEGPRGCNGTPGPARWTSFRSPLRKLSPRRRSSRAVSSVVFASCPVPPKRRPAPARPASRAASASGFRPRRRPYEQSARPSTSTRSCSVASLAALRHLVGPHRRETGPPRGRGGRQRLGNRASSMWSQRPRTGPLRRRHRARPDVRRSARA